MIAVSSKSQSFDQLAHYLERGRSGQAQDRVDWTASRNLPTADPALGAKIMRATAQQNDRVQRPVYHLVLSFDPRDAVDRDTMERVANGVLDRLGLAEHQAILVAHRDRAHAHIHIMINRVHPTDGRAWEMAYDYRVIQRALRETEHALGLHELPDRRGRAARERPVAASEVAPPQAPTPDPTSGVERRVNGTTPSERSARTPVHEAPAEGASGSPGATLPAAARGRPDGLLGVPERIETSERGAAIGRVGGAAREQYDALMTLEAARARLDQMERIMVLARDAEHAFQRSLATVYRDPDEARKAFLRAMDKEGVSAALRTLREEPERFGALLGREERRFFGLLRRTDTAPARAAARVAAGRAHEWIETERIYWAVASESRVGRAEDAFLRELRALYRQPATAQREFERLARESGVEHAAEVLRTRPQALGTLHARAMEYPGNAAMRARSAADVGRELVAARMAAKADAMRVKVASLAGELTEARTSVQDAERWYAVASQRHRALTRHRTRAARVLQGLQLLGPSEFRAMQRVHGSPSAALSHQVRAAWHAMVHAAEDGHAR